MDHRFVFYKQKFNLHHAVFLPIEHADAMVAIVYKVIFPKRSACILKICPRAEDYWREVYFLNLFSKQLPVPKIIQTEPPSSLNDGAILMEFLPGMLPTKKEMTDKLIYESGALLARIHLNRVQHYGDLTQEQNLSLDPRVPFAHKFEEGFLECSYHLPKNILEKSSQYYTHHIDALSLVDGPCIIHRDFRPGNLIVLNDQVTGIIDWASARASFAEEDFTPLELDEWSIGAALKKSFLNGYASVRPVPEYKQIMPLLLMNRAFNIIGFTIKKGTWDNVNARVYQANVKYLETFTD